MKTTSKTEGIHNVVEIGAGTAGLGGQEALIERLRKPFSSAFDAPDWNRTSSVELVETIINTEKN